MKWAIYSLSNLWAIQIVAKTLPFRRGSKRPVPKKFWTCKFKQGWTLPQHISCKGRHFRVLSPFFSAAHGGFSDIKRHVSVTVHQQRLKDLCGMSAIGTFFQKDSTHHQRNVISAEVHMANLAQSLLSNSRSTVWPIVPESKIASNFGCKHTKTKAICCDALDPYHKKPVVEMAQATTINLLRDEGAPVERLTILMCIFDSINGVQVLATRHFDTVA